MIYKEFCRFSSLKKLLTIVKNLKLITGIVNNEKIVIYYILIIEMQKPAF
jgi:hypothetical protein